MTTLTERETRKTAATGFQRPLDYLTALIGYLQSLAQARVARQEMDRGPHRTKRRRPDDDEPDEGRLLTRLKHHRAEAERRWAEFQQRTKLTLAEGKVDLPLETIARDNGLDATPPSDCSSPAHADAQRTRKGQARCLRYASPRTRMPASSTTQRRPRMRSVSRIGATRTRSRTTG